MEDEDGDTCLHLALMRQSVAAESCELSPALTEIQTQLGLTQVEGQTGIIIACYLTHKGASLTHKNHSSKTPLDLIPDSRLQEAIREFVVKPR